MTPLSPLDRDLVQDGWSAFARDDARITAPPELQARVRRSAARQQAFRLPGPPALATYAQGRWLPGLTAALVGAVAAGVVLGRPSAPTVPQAAPAPLAAVEGSAEMWAALRPAAAMVRPTTRDSHSRPPAVPAGSVPAPAALRRADLAGGGEALQVVRVRVEASALDAFGVQVAGPVPAGLVDVDLVVGDDGWPRDVRRIRPVTVDPPE